jgi:DNA replication protein DnaC
MIRIGETQAINQLMDQVPKNNRLEKPRNLINELNKVSKEQMWQKFLETFCAMYNKEFIQNERTINNLKVIFFYFLKDEKFFDCDNLRGDIIKPSFEKGLLIIGGFGLGKTDYFKVFEKVFEKFNNYRFKFYSSKELVNKYELCQTAFDKKYFFKDISRKRMFIDDIASERIASNYGKIDVVAEVLSNRYDKRLITYASCNYSDKSFSSKKTLEYLGLRYGPRLYDRFYEMFNIIEFTEKSYRGR